MAERLRLGVNVDHVATLRQARGTDYPDPLQAARAALASGADLITVHLREDRRHIQDHDVARMLAEGLPLNLEMAVTEEMLGIALAQPPQDACLVPERREELTTEGGLDVRGHLTELGEACARLAAAGIRVSLFVDPEPEQIAASAEAGAPMVELHTGAYAEAVGAARGAELERLREAARCAVALGLEVHAGHGLHYDNTAAIAAIPEIVELNTGHAIVAAALLEGFGPAVARMRTVMDEGRAGGATR